MKYIRTAAAAIAIFALQLAPVFADLADPEDYIMEEASNHLPAVLVVIIAAIGAVTAAIKKKGRK